VISNYSGTSANVYFNISANGTTVFRDAVSLNNTMRGVNGALWLVRETDTTAAIITLGSQAGPASIGQGDFGGTAAGAVTISTNVSWNWATNNTLLVEFQCDTATSTNDALGMRMAWSYLRAEAAASSGSGDVVGPASSTTNNIAVFADATGKVIADGGVTVASLATEAEVAAGYEPLNANKYQATNSVLTTLATLNGGSLTNLNASSIASGTLSSNRLPADIALTSLSAGTLTATSVTGDGSGLTNLNGSNIASGTLADARIPATIARTNAPTLHSPTLLTPSLGVASATSLTLGATNVVTDLALKAPLASPALTGTPTVNGTNLMAAIASAGGGGGGLTLIDAAPITNVNFRSSWANKASVSSVTNVDWIPQPPTTASSASLTPAFDSSRGHEFTLTNNATLNAPSGVASGMVGDTFRLVFIQDSTGGRTLTAATNYLFGSDITGLTLTTNAGARDYAVVYVRRTNVFDVVGFVRGYAQ
jgi:hypothetical protein